MPYIRQKLLASLLPASGFVLCLAMAARADTVQTLPIDTTEQVQGIEAACTGVGDREENEARWKSFPVKMETVGGYGQWLGNEQITLHGHDGVRLLRVRCSGPWVLMGLRPGSYTATIRVPDAPARHVRFIAPREGQRDVIVRFSGLRSGEQATGS